MECPLKRIYSLARISSLEDLCLRRISQLSTAQASQCHLKFHTALHKASSWLDCRAQSSSTVTAHWSWPYAVHWNIPVHSIGSVHGDNLPLPNALACQKFAFELQPVLHLPLQQHPSKWGVPQNQVTVTSKRLKWMDFLNILHAWTARTSVFIMIFSVVLWGTAKACLFGLANWLLRQRQLLV